MNGNNILVGFVVNLIWIRRWKILKKSCVFGQLKASKLYICNQVFFNIELKK